MLVKLSGTPDFKFTATSQNGSTLGIGASKSIGGDESGFRPMELVLAALGSCSAIDTVNILKKSRVNFTSLDIEVDGTRKDGAIPSPYTSITIKFFVHGVGLERAKVEKAVSLSLEKYCSVSASLDPNIVIKSETILDAE